MKLNKKLFLGLGLGLSALAMSATVIACTKATTKADLDTLVDKLADNDTRQTTLTVDEALTQLYHGKSGETGSTTHDAKKTDHKDHAKDVLTRLKAMLSEKEAANITSVVTDVEVTVSEKDVVAGTVKLSIVFVAGDVKSKAKEVTVSKFKVVTLKSVLDAITLSSSFVTATPTETVDAALTKLFHGAPGTTGATTHTTPPATGAHTDHAAGLLARLKTLLGTTEGDKLTKYVTDVKITVGNKTSTSVQLTLTLVGKDNVESTAKTVTLTGFTAPAAPASGS